MNRKIVGAMLAFMIVCTMLLVPQADAQKTVTITDSLGREVEIPYPVERVVNMNTFANEAIAALGGEDKVVGVDLSIKFFPEFYPTLRDKPVVGFHHFPSYEKIIEVDPDVVIYSSELMWSPGFEEIMEKAGIKPVCTSFWDPETYDRDVRNLGIILGKEKRAEEYLDFAHSYINMVEERVKDIPPDERVKVYWEVMFTDMTMGKPSPLNSLIEMAGGRNIFSETGGASFAMPTGAEFGTTASGGFGGEKAKGAISAMSIRMVSSEEIIERNPEVIIGQSMSMKSMMKSFSWMMKKPGMMRKILNGELSEEEVKEMLKETEMRFAADIGALRDMREGIMNRSEIKATDAGINGRVYVFPVSMHLFFSPSWPMGLCYLAKALYPDRFEDFDLEDLHAEWLKKQDVLEGYKGTWVYPQEIKEK
ncbi:MAG: corrinoid ABC transporter substrate-binding protein [Candidatus Methanolliviera sp. GoM_oil]|nr:MAG: corrinoid ABC transporter substrate-binding protein [Candidatus Methanolliviera sp. GoM_oil]